ncbi:uncharacterized protein [Pleurodeles waltl]|uniref:uncharacterized protein isoform X2 n=1 Tax=Pleurodeles waltl TaxID=8319 RepID=UPI003709C5B8
MKASSLVGLLTAVVLMATTASAPPPGPTPRVPASENKQTVVLKKPAPIRKGPGQPSRDFRPAKKKTGSPYYTGHRSVAFLTMGEIDVIQRFPEDFGTASPMDPCLGCCTDIENHIPASESEPESPDMNHSHNSMKLEPGLGAIGELDLESSANSTIDHCLGCCDAAIEISTSPMPPLTSGGGSSVPLTSTVLKVTGKQATEKTTQNHPLKRPRKKTTRWGSSAVSSSEEEGMGKFILRREGGTPMADRTEVAERATPKYNPSLKRKKMIPFLRHGCKSVPDSSSMSSSEEG